ncbi:hypothetical protein AVL50_16600 [Flammeovirga sp. SJP92]|nr:hypothetical protein AVL50_16600 [Flammeovirga sp. SJP92]
MIQKIISIALKIIIMSQSKIVAAAEAALDKLTKLNKKGEYEQQVNDLTWVLGSFKNDGNPDGVYQKVAEAKDVLADLKSKKPRSVAKALMDTLDEALA